MSEQEKGNGRTHEEQRTRMVEYQFFDLRKVKMTSKGADVAHQEGGSDLGMVTKLGETTAHPDLQKALDRLRPIMARRLGLLCGTDVARDIAKGDLSKYQVAMDKETEVINRCNVNGITFVGSGEKYGVMLTGSILVPGGGSVGLAVPKIAFELDTLGYESECEDLCEEVKKEVYAYRFQNKKAQLDLEFEANKADEEGKIKDKPAEEKPKGKGRGKKTELI